MEDHLAFVGSVPEKYDRYMGPIFFEPYAADLTSRLPAREGLRVLELACGTGIATRCLRDSLPVGALLVATDLNGPMIERARSKFRPDEHVEWQEADATALPFADGSFDVVVCQFGVMFFPDKLAAFREAQRVLGPGGEFLFSVWDALENNQLSLVAARAIGEFFPSDPPNFYDVPFGFHDTRRIESMLASAGFESSEILLVEKPGISATAVEAAVALVEGTPMIGQVLARAHLPVSEVVSAVAKAIADRFGDAPVQSTLTALLCRAR
jgi:ubiquinone/menaquinone biosynthesis C-methylase UbiE